MAINITEGLGAVIIIQVFWLIKKVAALNGSVKEIKRRCPLFKKVKDEDKL